MVILNKKETETLVKALSPVKNKKVEEIVKKMTSPQKRIRYAESLPEIREIIKKAFKEKRKIKIRYYSLSSDQVTTRIVNIYQMHDDCIVAYCNLRKEERTFIIRRINASVLLDDTYTIPKNWQSESIILCR